LISSVSEPFWEEYSDENIKNAEAQRLNAVQLRNVVDGILKKLVADIKQAVEKTRRSFDRRIYESKQAKQKLEDQLRDVNYKSNLIKKKTFFPYV
jgi:actin-related protein